MSEDDDVGDSLDVFVETVNISVAATEMFLFDENVLVAVEIIEIEGDAVVPGGQRVRVANHLLKGDEDEVRLVRRVARQVEYLVVQLVLRDRDEVAVQIPVHHQHFQLLLVMVQALLLFQFLLHLLVRHTLVKTARVLLLLVRQVRTQQLVDAPLFQMVLEHLHVQARNSLHLMTHHPHEVSLPLPSHVRVRAPSSCVVHRNSVPVVSPDVLELTTKFTHSLIRLVYLFQ